jgi:glycerol-3-phosphate acyltransferase PlsY
MPMDESLWLIWVALAYLAGSIPFGLLMGLARGVDIRNHGSGNVGATNAGRVLGKSWGIACFILDVLKGLLPVLLAGLAFNYAGQWDLTAAQAGKWLAVAVAAVVGHVFPVWLKFKGGKGVATGLGVLLAFWPILTIPGAVALLLWLVCVKIWRYVSLASIVAAVSLPLTLLIALLSAGELDADTIPFFVVVTLLALLVILRHRDNLARLRAGTESKIGGKRG